MSRFRRAALPRARSARTALARAALAGLGLACAHVSGCRSDPAAPLPADTPVVMVVVDTLSALHLELYGYEHATAPHLTEFARAATVFEHNTTQCNSTFPSITSILTGLYPKTHKNLLAVPTEGTFQTSTPGESLAERLAARGYHTLAVGSHPSWLDSGRDAIHRGWKRFSAIPPEASEPRALWANGAYTNERAFALLDEYERAPEGPLFLWVHYFDPHTDLENLVYAPPAEVRDRFLDVHLAELGVSDYAAELRARDPSARADYLLAQAPGPRRDDVWLANGRALYDAEIAYCDAQIARLFARLDELGILERALVVVLADHGENMDGRDTEGGRIDFTHLRLFETVARTPLILKLPGQRTGQRIAALTQNIDVLPTVLELLDLPRGAPVDGASLAGLLTGELERVHERVFIESSDNIEKAVRTDEWKYFDSDGTYAAGLFRWRADGLELDDRAAAAPAVAAELRESVQSFRPVETLRLVCTPAAEPYSVALELELPRSAVRSATDGAGRAAGEIEDGGRRFRFAGRVEGQPLALVLELQNRKPPFRWTLQKDGRAPDHGEVRLGQLALDQSAAIPLFRGALGEAAAAAADPTAPSIALTARGAELELAVRSLPGALLEVELGYEEPGYDKTFEVLASEGFAAPRSARGGRTVLSATAPEATARLRCSEAGDLLCLPRAAGSWPAREAMRWNGKAPAADALHVLWPQPNDPRLNAALLAAPELESLPPGSFAIWREGGGAVAFDPAHLDPERAAELRALGYLGSE